MLSATIPKSIELPRKNILENNNNLEKNCGPKIHKKSTFFPKISRSKSPKNLNYTKGTTTPYYLYAQKKLRKKLRTD
jgi:hypothetical protein